MLTPARLREYTGDSGALALLRDLAYPVSAVDVDPVEWRRGGVEIPWNGDNRLRLAVRMRSLDVFVLSGPADSAAIETFLRSYRSYNVVTKSVLLHSTGARLALYDLSSSASLRRMEVDLERPSPHSVDRLNLIACSDDSSAARIFDRALDRGSVTRHFFLRYRAAFLDLSAAIREACPEEPDEAAGSQALLLLSRLLFLSFIQEKGWLNGERRYLVDRLERYMRRKRDFYRAVLAPLFFGCLNTPAPDRDQPSRRLGSIPYLNGGLFEPSAFERRHPELTISNTLMQRVLEEVFERFDFRLEEQDDCGSEVDPEMLGRVFESLMAGDERLASGSFYTPREIVDLLTERAIRARLALPADPDPATAAALLETLSEISVLDPACGSGAFLLSALRVIERLWRELAAKAGLPVPPDVRRRIVSRCLYGVDVKPEAVRLCELRLWLAIVSGSEVGADRVEPLPNLDRNILQGNSLLSPTDFLGDARGDLYSEWVYALRAQRDLIDRYQTSPHSERPALYRIIRSNDERLAADLLARSAAVAERELEIACTPQRDLFGRPLPVDSQLCQELHARVLEARRLVERVEDGAVDFFSYDIHFAHVVARGGFDVVLGNPPWVRHSRIEPRARKMLADRYPLFRAHGGQGFHQPDLSTAFFERAMQLAAPGGAIALLMPAKIVNAAYAGRLRRAARDRCRILTIDDWSDDPRRRRWFSADTFPLGIVMQTTSSADAEKEVPGGRPIRVTAAGEPFALRQAELAVSGPFSEWALVPPTVASILTRLRTLHPTLEGSLGRRPFMGVKTGDNRAFFVEERAVRGAHLITSEGDRIPLSALCRCVRGRDLERWRSSTSQWMLWPPGGGWAKPPQWLEPLAERHGIDPEAFRLSFVRAEHVGIKVAWKDLSRGLVAAVLPDAVNIGARPFPLVPNQTLYAIDAVSLDEAWSMAAVLNSTVAGALLVSVAERAKDAHYRYFGRTVAAMPFPDLRQSAGRLVRLARRATSGKPISPELDEAVAALFGISSEELQTLQEFLARRLGAR